MRALGELVYESALGVLLISVLDSLHLISAGVGRSLRLAVSTFLKISTFIFESILDSKPKPQDAASWDLDSEENVAHFVPGRTHCSCIR